ncbi:SDR family oxidoreductase [Acidothermaceae bacterium B102]|nr:SDR family oxidoreductase [Acidothermaceae bacterium B102]
MGMLDGRMAVVTGGSAGIGLAIARRFAREGAFVVVTGRNADRLADAVDLIGHEAVGVLADASQPADVARLFDRVGAFGRPLDVLVANADVSFDAMLLTVTSALDVLRDGASVVLVSSIAGGNGGAGNAVYNANKAAVRSLARTLANDLRGRRIRVNALSPGPTETEGFERFLGGQAAAVRAAIMQAVPLGRIGHPDEVASAALFLAGDESSFVDGIELVVDGGMSQI